MSLSFEEILKKPASTFVDPIPTPVGTYHTLIDGIPEQGQSSQKKTPQLTVKFKIMRALEDVDEDQAKQGNVVGKIITENFYLTPEAMPRLRRLFEHCGINTDMPTEQCIAELPNKQVLIKIGHEASPDGTRVFTRVRATAAAV